MRVLVVDDEAPARQRLRRLLEEDGAHTVCGEAADGREALARVTAARPDVVLLDIRMPGMDGLEAARHLRVLEHPPAVIFTTAYSDHALEAFEASAVDYLLKPIRAERLRAALAGAQRLTRAQERAVERVGAGARSHFCVRHRGNLELVPVAAVRYFRAEQKYVVARHDRGEVLLDESLKQLAHEFDGRFLRVHRNALVAVAHLEGLEKDKEGRLRVRLAGVPEGPEVSRRHAGELRRRLKQL